MKELQHINKYFYKYRYKLLSGIIITIIARIFLLFTPELIGEIVDTITKKINGEITLEVYKKELTINLLYLVGAAIVGGIFTFLMRQTLINVSRYVEYDLKNEVYQQYQRLSLGFYKSNRTGDLMSRISEDVGKVREYVGPALMYSINTLTLFIIALFLMFREAPMLTLYTIIPLPILSFFIYVLSKKIHKKSTIVQVWLAKLSTFTQESFSGVSVIKSYSIEDQINRDFDILSAESRQKNIDLVKVQALFFPLMIFLIGLRS